MAPRIVTYVHRYKRPPKKRKAVALEVPVVTPPGRATEAAPTAIVQTKPRKGSKGAGWANDGAPSDPAMRAVILRLMRGRPGDG